MEIVYAKNKFKAMQISYLIDICNKNAIVMPRFLGRHGFCIAGAGRATPRAAPGGVYKIYI